MFVLLIPLAGLEATVTNLRNGVGVGPALIPLLIGLVALAALNVWNDTSSRLYAGRHERERDDLVARLEALIAPARPLTPTGNGD